MANLGGYQSAAGAGPAAVPVLHNATGGDAWGRVHAMLAEARSITAAGRGVELLRQTLGADEVTLSKLVRNGGETWMAVIPFAESYAIEWWPLADHPAVQRVIDSGVPRQVADTDPTADRSELEVLEAGGYRALLLLPIELDGIELGLLEVYSSAPKRWSVTEIAHARAASNQLASLLLQPAGRRADVSAAVLGNQFDRGQA